jgi:hypothetical protein
MESIEVELDKILNGRSVFSDDADLQFFFAEAISANFKTFEKTNIMLFVEYQGNSPEITGFKIFKNYRSLLRFFMSRYETSRHVAFYDEGEGLGLELAFNLVSRGVTYTFANNEGRIKPTLLRFRDRLKKVEQISMQELMEILYETYKKAI